jgi:DNA-binding NarL/FixJ family response regulator
MVIKVLVADNKIMRRAILFLLRDRDGIAVVGEASTLSEAIQKSTELHPDVILLDLNMPENDGVPSNDLLNGRVIATSLRMDEDAKALAENLGASLLLDKMKLGDELIPAILQKAPHNIPLRSTAVGV